MSIPTPEKTLSSFAARLASVHKAGEEELLAPSASLLPCFLSSSTTNDLPSCMFPSMSLHSSGRSRSPSQKGKKNFDSIMSERLGSPLQFGKHNIASAPSTILRNISLSFGTMIDLRLKGTTVALLRRALRSEALERSDGPSKEVRALTTLMSFSTSASPISLSTAVTNFKTILPSRDVTRPDDQNPRIVLPLVFETTFYVRILDSFNHTVTVEAPGMITGSFTNPNNRLGTVEIVLETSALLRSMKECCRSLVQQAISLACSNVSESVVAPSPKEQTDSCRDSSEENEVELCMAPPPPRSPRDEYVTLEGKQIKAKRRRLSASSDVYEGPALIRNSTAAQNNFEEVFIRS